MQKCKSGHKCAVKNCKCSYDSNKSFFRLPKDIERSRTWLMASNREDLLHLDVEKLHQNYRICSLHFERKMFTNINCNRLKHNATPTIFPSLEATSLSVEHNYCLPILVIKQEPSLNQPGTVESVDINPGLGESSVKATEHNVTINTDQSLVFCSSSSTQTPAFKSSRQKLYRNKIRKLMRENKSLKQRVHLLENAKKDATLEEYQALTYKFCSNEMAIFINNQVAQSQKQLHGRRYSDEFKKECLKIYLSAPKVYRQYLSKELCLPSTETLLRQIRIAKIPNSVTE